MLFEFTPFVAYALESVSKAEFDSVILLFAIATLLVGEYQPKAQDVVFGIPSVAKSPFVTSSAPS